MYRLRCVYGDMAGSCVDRYNSHTWTKCLDRAMQYAGSQGFDKIREEWFDGRLLMPEVCSEVNSRLMQVTTAGLLKTLLNQRINDKYIRVDGFEAVRLTYNWKATARHPYFSVFLNQDFNWYRWWEMARYYKGEERLSE